MKKSRLLFALIIFTTFFFSCGNDAKENIVVIVKYKTLPNKNIDALASLDRLIEEVKREDHFVELKLHVDQQDNSNILLYEIWNDEQYYKGAHMETDHLQQFKTESEEFLVGPPEISYWKEHSVYE